MCHLYKIGDKLDSLTRDNEDVKEYFDELVPEWPPYLARLAEYKQRIDGFLH
jgi:hypothetical protein